MKLSIVVVTWQSADALERLVVSMNRHLEGDEELIVVDNASGDDPLAAAASWRGRGWFLRMDANLGFGAAVNAGVARAGGDVVVVLNPDTWLVDRGLPRLAELALRTGAIVGPAVRSPNGSRQPSASGPPVGVWPWVRAFLPSGLGPRWVIRRTAPWRLETLTPVSWLTGACLAAPRTVLTELGPFDPAIHLYAEDLDLGLRAAAAGVGSCFAPSEATIVHAGKASTAQVFDDLGRAQAARNGRAVLRRRYGARREQLAWAAEVVGLRLRVAVKGLVGRERTWEQTVLAGLLGARPAPSLPPLTAAGARTPAPVEQLELPVEGPPER